MHKVCTKAENLVLGNGNNGTKQRNTLTYSLSSNYRRSVEYIGAGRTRLNYLHYK